MKTITVEIVWASTTDVEVDDDYEWDGRDLLDPEWAPQVNARDAEPVHVEVWF